MKNSLVKDWMSKDPVTADVHTILPDAHRILLEKKIRRLLVTENGKLVGIVTRGDIRGAEPSAATSLSIYELNYLLAKLTLDKIMKRNPLTVTATTSVGEAARLMLENKIAGLPVVEGDKLVGIITESDIFRMVVKTWDTL
ncbi:MAG: CBS domain-containing protein [Chloroflexi bacterium]|nr:CBS domain-containing protein [Chloroflexota bacterium]MBI5081616.1 CBS domain-containing protein [Chloroflexota bacterium]MBI5713235.1 CBS domain-containing protein [Chloroflexota bacterium]